MHPELRFIRQSVKVTNKISKKQNMQQNNIFYKKIAVSVVAAVFLAILYGLIFSFSEQDGETSGSLSRMISEKCVELLNSLSGKNWSQIMMDSMATYFEHPIRKLAHFMEYACMAVLVYGVWRPWMSRGKSLYLLIILWVAVSAAGDELHQLFVPDRYGSVADVLLDTCGGAFGLWGCVLSEKIFGRKKDRVKRKK